MQTSAPVPPGYAPIDQHSPLTAPWAPIYARAESTRVSLAIRLEQQHCNSRGLVHGGLLCAIADLAMGRSALLEAQHRGFGVRSGVTTSLNIDFLESAEEGELLEWMPEVLRGGKALSVVECRVFAGERLIARAGATFRLLHPPG